MTLSQRIGRFQVERALGSGSFSTVWLARDEDLDAWVAIKVLADNWSLNEDARRRFLEEARALRRLDSDRIVRAYEVGRIEDGRPYIVMEFADRGSLEDRMRFRAQMRRPFSVAEAIGAGTELVECLISVHALRIVHRDVKPSNVLFRSVAPEVQEALRRSGKRADGERMLLGDFGIARRLELGGGHTMVVGSPQYMAPEQADPATAAHVDERSDVYSAAVVVYELLTGRTPGASPTTEPLRAIRPDAPPVLTETIEHAMAKEPASRFRTAWELRERLIASLAEVEPRLTPWEALPGARPEPAPRPAPAAPVTDLLASPTRTRVEAAVAVAAVPAPTAVAAAPPVPPVQPAEPVPWEDDRIRPRPRIGALDSAVLALVAGVLLAVGTFLPWRQGTGSSLQVIGLDLRGGTIAFAVGGALALATLLRFTGRGKWSLRFVRVVAMLGGAAALGAVGFEAFQIIRLLPHVAVHAVRSAVGLGLELALGGAALALLAAWRARRQLRALRALTAAMATPAPPAPGRA